MLEGLWHSYSLHKVIWRVQLTSEQHRDWTVWANIYMVFLMKSTALYYSEIGWVLRCRTTDMEGRLWDLSMHGFWFLVGVGSLPLFYWGTTALPFLEFLLPIYSFPVLSVCEPSLLWMNDWIQRKKGIQFTNDNSHFWEYTIYIVVEMSTRGRGSQCWCCIIIIWGDLINTSSWTLPKTN